MFTYVIIGIGIVCVSIFAVIIFKNRERVIYFTLPSGKVKVEISSDKYEGGRKWVAKFYRMKNEHYFIYLGHSMAYKSVAEVKKIINSAIPVLKNAEEAGLKIKNVGLLLKAESVDNDDNCYHVIIESGKWYRCEDPETCICNQEF
jgi:hypothetical protein